MLTNIRTDLFRVYEPVATLRSYDEIEFPKLQSPSFGFIEKVEEDSEEKPSSTLTSLVVPDPRTQTSTNSPYKSTIIVDKKTLNMEYYDDLGNLKFKSRVSTGKNSGLKQKVGDMRTPEGTFTISGFENRTDKYARDNFGKQPWVYRLNTPGWTGILFHGDANEPDKIGTPASKGCIRLPNDKLEELHNILGEDNNALNKLKVIIKKQGGNMRLISKNPVLRFKQGRKILFALPGNKLLYIGRDGKKYIAKYVDGNWTYSLLGLDEFKPMPKNYITTDGYKFYNNNKAIHPDKFKHNSKYYTGRNGKKYVAYRTSGFDEKGNPTGIWRYRELNTNDPLKDVPEDYMTPEGYNIYQQSYMPVENTFTNKSTLKSPIRNSTKNNSKLNFSKNIILENKNNENNDISYLNYKRGRINNLDWNLSWINRTKNNNLEQALINFNAEKGNIYNLNSTQGFQKALMDFGDTLGFNLESASLNFADGKWGMQSQDYYNLVSKQLDINNSNTSLNPKVGQLDINNSNTSLNPKVGNFNTNVTYNKDNIRANRNINYSNVDEYWNYINNNKNSNDYKLWLNININGKLNKDSFNLILGAYKIKGKNLGRRNSRRLANLLNDLNLIGTPNTEARKSFIENYNLEDIKNRTGKDGIIYSNPHVKNLFDKVEVKKDNPFNFKFNIYDY